MAQSISISPSNGIVFLSDGTGGRPPDPVRGAMFWSTPSCIVVMCLPEPDGDTLITLARREELSDTRTPDFQGRLEITDGRVVVSVVDRTISLQLPWPKKSVTASVWLSHPEFPERISIGLS
jgi:hypothetical protein